MVHFSPIEFRRGESRQLDRATILPGAVEFQHVIGGSVWQSFFSSDGLLPAVSISGGCIGVLTSSDPAPKFAYPAGRGQLPAGPC